MKQEIALLDFLLHSFSEHRIVIHSLHLYSGGKNQPGSVLLSGSMPISHVHPDPEILDFRPNLIFLSISNVKNWVQTNEVSPSFITKPVVSTIIFRWNQIFLYSFRSFTKIIHTETVLHVCLVNNLKSSQLNWWKPTRKSWFSTILMTIQMFSHCS